MRKKKPPPHQADLLTGKSRFQIEQEQELDQRKLYLKSEISLAEALINDPCCRRLWALNFERYLDSRMPWWLHLDPEHPEAPSIGDYEIGNYWTGHKQGSEEFILARAKWAMPLLKQQLSEVKIALGLNSFPPFNGRPWERNEVKE